MPSRERVMTRIPDPKLVRKVIVVTEDVFGPMQNSLYLDLADGTSVCLWKKRVAEKFIVESGKIRPAMAGSIKSAFNQVGDTCCERMFNLDTH
jgi:hypothetical protein